MIVELTNGNDITHEEHAKTVAAWVLKTMMDNKSMAVMTDGDGSPITDHQKLYDARIEALTEVFMKINVMELMTIRDAFERQPWTSAMKMMVGIAG